MKKQNTSTQMSVMFSQLAAEKKKIVMAMCLLCIMGFMWVRVLLRKGPQDAGAATTKVSSKTGHIKEVEYNFIELPEIEGRNDVLKRDFFSVNSWRKFVKGDVSATGVEDADDADGYIQKLKNNLKLEAIVEGDDPQVFINGELYSDGQTITVNVGGKKFKCEIIAIRDSEVVLDCFGEVIKLKLSDMIEVSS